MFRYNLIDQFGTFNSAKYYTIINNCYIIHTLVNPYYKMNSFNYRLPIQKNKSKEKIWPH